jgi:uncharacterized protein (TIGR00251 family)
VVGYEGQMLKIRLRALPEKGDANAELVRILAEFFDLPRSHIEIKRGHTSRIKQLQIYGIEGQGALKKLKEMGAFNSIS